MIGIEDALYITNIPIIMILPSINDWSSDSERIGNGVRVDPDFTYSSDNNEEWMEVHDLKDWIEKNRNKIGTI